MTEFIEVTATYRRKVIYGCGINDATYVPNPTINGKKYSCPYYRVWNSMLRRCYSINYQKTRPTYKGCSVHSDWLIFSNFKSWMLEQDWKGKQLDKDLLVKGNKVYSPETCIFVSAEVNSLLGVGVPSTTNYKTGVTKGTGRKPFVAQCSVANKQVHLGNFTTEDEAHSCYVAYKVANIIRVANSQIDNRLKEVLLRYANNISSNDIN